MAIIQGPLLSKEEVGVLDSILAKLSGPGAELPPALFRFATEIVATPNVDLLVWDGTKRVLLAWREDAFGTGWHVPGSIIRHREEIGHRLRACASEEFGCKLSIGGRPIALIQIFDDRGHSVSLCYAATLLGTPNQRVVHQDDTPHPGDLCWFAQMPDSLYPSHRIYRSVIEALRQDRLGGGIEVFVQHVGHRDAELETAEGAISADESLSRTAL